MLISNLQISSENLVISTPAYFQNLKRTEKNNISIYQVTFALATIEIGLGHISGIAKRTGSQFWRLLTLLVRGPLLSNDGLDFLPVLGVDFVPVL